MNEIITLENGLMFVVLKEIDYDGESYLYLSSYDEDVNLIFARVEDDTISPIEDGNLIVRLLNLLGNQKEVNV